MAPRNRSRSSISAIRISVDASKAIIMTKYDKRNSSIPANGMQGPAEALELAGEEFLQVSRRFASVSFRAGVVQWQYRSFPSFGRGFDSHRPLQKSNCHLTGRLQRAFPDSDTILTFTLCAARTATWKPRISPASA